MSHCRNIVVMAALAAFFFASACTAPEDAGDTVTSGSLAQTQSIDRCAPREIAVAKLKQHYGEGQIGIGIGSRGAAVLEIFVAEMGTWTVLVTRRNGISCIAASGDNWMTSPLLTGDPT